MTEPVLALEGVSKSFEGACRPHVFADVDLEVRPGEFVAVTGPSGQGKSTLLSVAGGLLRPDAGVVKFKGESVYHMPEARLDKVRSAGIGFIFQKPRTFAALTARENLRFALKRRHGKQTFERAEKALASYGLEDVADNLPSQLSYGQLRRLSIARTLAMEPELLLVDEPTNDLDETWCEKVMADLAGVASELGCAVVVVTHDTRYVPRVPVRYELTGEGLHPCV